MENLKCVGLQFNMFFDPYSEIRTKSNAIEEILKETFSDGLVTLPNPGPAAPNEIPRVLGNSHDGMYQIAISNVNASFSKVKFTPEEKIEIILKDFKMKLDSVYDAIINVLPDKKLTICGITLFINVTDKANVNDFMLKRFINKEPLDQMSKGLEIYDIGTKYTFTQDSKYYINLSFNSVRSSVEGQPELTIQLDINDRYRFNINKGADNYSEKNIKDILYNISKKMIEKDIVDLVKGD